MVIRLVNKLKVKYKLRPNSKRRFLIPEKYSKETRLAQTQKWNFFIGRGPDDRRNNSKPGNLSDNSSLNIEMMRHHEIGDFYPQNAWIKPCTSISA